MSVYGLAQGWEAASCGREKEAGGALRIQAVQNKQKDRGGVMFTRVYAPCAPWKASEVGRVSPVGGGRKRVGDKSREGS